MDYILASSPELSNEYNELSSFLSDYSKDVWGTRTRRGCANQFSTEEELIQGIESLKAEIAQLDAIAPGIWAQEAKEEQERVQAFEQRILEIQQLVLGSTREDAIRYIADAEDCTNDIEHLEWRLGIPFGYISGKKPGQVAA
jgi:hypothetical protein